eukprot:3521935-Pyramimonas_sp.AAC.1
MQAAEYAPVIVASLTERRVGKRSGMTCDTSMLRNACTHTASLQCHCLTNVTLRYGLASHSRALTQSVHSL